MRTPTTAELLEIWDCGLHARPARRALLLLEAACPERSAEALARLSIGRRNTLLLQLRALTFGPRLEMRARCPHCAEALELGCAVADLTADVEPDQPEALELEHRGCRVRFRLPDSLDLEAVADLAEAGAARDLLLARCILAATPEMTDGSSKQILSEVGDLLAARMEQADPQADMRLALSCPACGRGWLAVFEIVGFFWEELQAWALRTLRDVHTLAMAYGWREADILALSPQRRQCYLELIRA